MMTDGEFKTWTRHTADNLIAQRDDALVRIADAKTAADAATAKFVVDLAAATDPLNTKIAELNQTVAQRDATITDLRSKISAYEAEALLPAVKAQIKAARIAAAQKRKADAVAARVAADAEITALG